MRGRDLPSAGGTQEVVDASTIEGVGVAPRSPPALELLPLPVLPLPINLPGRTRISSDGGIGKTPAEHHPLFPLFHLPTFSPGFPRRSLRGGSGGGWGRSGIPLPKRRPRGLGRWGRTEAPPSRGSIPQRGAGRTAPTRPSPPLRAPAARPRPLRAWRQRAGRVRVTRATHTHDRAHGAASPLAFAAKPRQQRHPPPPLPSRPCCPSPPRDVARPGAATEAPPPLHAPAVRPGGGSAGADGAAGHHGEIQQQVKA